MKTYHFLKIFFGIFALIGIGMLAGGIFWIGHNLAFRQTAVEVPAQIIDIETYYDSDGDSQHHVWVAYTHGGTTYSGVPLNEYSSNMYIGKEITIWCNPEDPYNVISDTGIWLGGCILLFMGVVFAAVGIVPFITSTLKAKREKHLLENGQVLYATVENIVWNTSLSVNGRHPYVIYCTYKDEYKDITYRFKSNNLWTNPESVFPPGSEIQVYVERNNYRKYYVNADTAVSQRIVDYT